MRFAFLTFSLYFIVIPATAQYQKNYEAPVSYYQRAVNVSHLDSRTDFRTNGFQWYYGYPDRESPRYEDVDYDSRNAPPGPPGPPGHKG